MHVLLASVNRTASGNAVVIAPTGTYALDAAREATFLLTCTGVDGTNPTLDVWMQVEILPGVWLDWVAFAQVTAEGSQLAAWQSRVAPTAALRALADGAMADGVQQGPLPGGAWRVKWTIGGTDTPGFEFSVAGSWGP